MTQVVMPSIDNLKLMMSWGTASPTTGDLLGALRELAQYAIILEARVTELEAGQATITVTPVVEWSPEVGQTRATTSISVGDTNDE